MVGWEMGSLDGGPVKILTGHGGRFCRYQSNIGKKAFLERIIFICA
jgi:hypothetical protein